MPSVSTHVLDSARGGSRTGTLVELHDLSGSLVGSGRSDERGRVDPLSEGIPPGTYRITWHVEGELMGTITATVHLTGERHYHLPIVASGFAASLYLGG